MLYFPYKFQENLGHREYYHSFLVSTGLSEVLDKTLSHVVIQMFKFLSNVEAVANDGLFGLLCEPQLRQWFSHFQGVISKIRTSAFILVIPELWSQFPVHRKFIINVSL